MKSSIEKTRKTAFNNIDDAAERARIRFYTSRLNQVLIYMEKTNEAIEFLAEPKADIKNYPLMYAEVQATDQDPHTVAMTILDRRAEWLRLCSQIERIRMSGKSYVRKLDDEHEIRQSCERSVAALDRLTPERVQSEYGR